MIGGSPEAVACGIDVEDLARFDAVIERVGDGLLQDICTEREMAGLRPDRRLHMALAFSCKEAVFKALGASWTNSPISWREIELLFTGPGFDRHEIVLSGYAEALFRECGGSRLDLALEYGSDHVVAQVVLIGPRRNVADGN